MPALNEDSALAAEALLNDAKVPRGHGKTLRIELAGKLGYGSHAILEVAKVEAIVAALEWYAKDDLKSVDDGILESEDLRPAKAALATWGGAK